MTAKVPTEDAPKELQQGVQVQLSNGLTAVVKEVTPAHVVIDANHTLAGKDLTFDVELIQLQKVCYSLILGLWLCCCLVLARRALLDSAAVIQQVSLAQHDSCNEAGELSLTPQL